MQEVYEVIIQDEYNNLYFIGFYHKLENSIKDINDFLKVYDIQIKSLEKYPSTTEECFDTYIIDKNGEETGVMIRGFIFNKEAVGEIKCEDE